MADAARPVRDAAMAAVDCALRADVALRLDATVSRMQRFLAVSGSARDLYPAASRDVARALCEQARRLVSRLTDAGTDGAATEIEQLLRAAYRLTASLATLAAWNAPAAQESHALNSFEIAARPEAAAYARFGSAAITAQETAYAQMLGFDGCATRLLMTASGMSAYAVIEAFLLREVLHEDACVLLHPGVYFETAEQVRSLPRFRVATAAVGNAQAMLDAIDEHQPAVVFVDPLTNNADLRLTHLPRLLDEADRLCLRETWFVIDGTLLSGACDPFAKRKQVRVLYYESGCKYLQFGLDLGPCGVLVAAHADAERLERLRRGLGAIGSEQLALPRASRTDYFAYLQSATACAEAAAQAVVAARRGHSQGAIEPIHPSLPTHPDHRDAQVYQHLGGLLTFVFRDPALNRRTALEAFVDRVITAARIAGLPLTAGTSFGFRTPRLSAAWSGYEPDAVFLRLSAGCCMRTAAGVGALIARCAEEFAAHAAERREAA